MGRVHDWSERERKKSGKKKDDNDDRKNDGYRLERGKEKLSRKNDRGKEFPVEIQENLANYFLSPLSLIQLFQYLYTIEMITTGAQKKKKQKKDRVHTQANYSPSILNNARKIFGWLPWLYVCNRVAIFILQRSFVEFVIRATTLRQIYMKSWTMPRSLARDTGSTSQFLKLRLILLLPYR